MQKYIYLLYPGTKLLYFFLIELNCLFTVSVKHLLWCPALMGLLGTTSSHISPKFYIFLFFLFYILKLYNSLKNYKTLYVNRALGSIDREFIN